MVFGQVHGDDHQTSRAAIHKRIHSATVGRFDIGDKKLDYPGASVGVITSTPDDKDAETLLQRADAAMYAVKAQRRGWGSRGGSRGQST